MQCRKQSSYLLNFCVIRVFVQKNYYGSFISDVQEYERITRKFKVWKLELCFASFQSQYDIQ